MGDLNTPNFPVPNLVNLKNPDIYSNWQHKHIDHIAIDSNSNEKFTTNVWNYHTAISDHLPVISDLSRAN